MPKESPSLANNGEVVHVALPSLYRALSYVCRSISPTRLKLSDAMPISNINTLSLDHFNSLHKIRLTIFAYIYICMYICCSHIYQWIEILFWTWLTHFDEKPVPLPCHNARPWKTVHSPSPCSSYGIIASRFAI